MTKTSLSDEIRKFTKEHCIEPARRRGEQLVRVRVGDVHREMKLQGRVPAVCQALSSHLFLNENALELEGREGPPSGQSTTVLFTYRLAGKPSGPESRREIFESARGIARGLFSKPGDWEKSIRRDREGFYSSGLER
jgi:hypothetical protein